MLETLAPVVILEQQVPLVHLVLLVQVEWWVKPGLLDLLEHLVQLVIVDQLDKVALLVGEVTLERQVHQAVRDLLVHVVQPDSLERQDLLEQQAVVVLPDSQDLPVPMVH